MAVIGVNYVMRSLSVENLLEEKFNKPI